MIKINFPNGATALNDYSGLKIKWVKTLDDLNRVEAENIFQAKKKYLKKVNTNISSWFNVSQLKKIHHDMFCDVWDWAGKFRKSVTSIGIKPYLISNQFGELCADIKAWSNKNSVVDLNFLEQAARVHHRLVFIHPFENGNGRFSRLIADRYLINCGCSHPNWPYLQDEGELRNEYIKSLKEADKGNYKHLIKFMCKLGAKDTSL